MNKITLYHGSPVIVEKPEYGKGKVNNDYGRGFYCTEHPELGKEWAVNEGTDGFVNKYTIDTDGLNILHLSGDGFTILHWLTLLVQNRRLRISSPVMQAGQDWLLGHYLIDISPYDAIIGYRADDSYFSFARAFLNNTISVRQLAGIMRLGDLGEQFVLKSPRAFDALAFDSCAAVSCTEYYPRRKARDEAARASFLDELGKDMLEGVFLRDLIKGDVKPDDKLLQ